MIDRLFVFFGGPGRYGAWSLGSGDYESIIDDFVSISKCFQCFTAYQSVPSGKKRRIHSSL